MEGGENDWVGVSSLSLSLVWGSDGGHLGYNLPIWCLLFRFSFSLLPPGIALRYLLLLLLSLFSQPSRGEERSPPILSLSPFFLWKCLPLSLSLRFVAASGTITFSVTSPPPPPSLSLFGLRILISPSCSMILREDENKERWKEWKKEREPSLFTSCPDVPAMLAAQFRFEI